MAYTIFCEGVPAGIFLGKKEADGVLSVNMDYTTPVYRDCSVGRFLYSRLKEEGFKKVICSEVHEAHKSYIGKMGFEGADIFLDYLSDQSKSMSVLYRTQIS